MSSGVNLAGQKCRSASFFAYDVFPPAKNDYSLSLWYKTEALPIAWSEGTSSEGGGRGSLHILTDSLRNRCSCASGPRRLCCRLVDDRSVPLPGAITNCRPDWPIRQACAYGRVPRRRTAGNRGRTGSGRPGFSAPPCSIVRRRCPFCATGPSPLASPASSLRQTRLCQDTPCCLRHSGGTGRG